jgi:hypothetical protein
MITPLTLLAAAVIASSPMANIPQNPVRLAGTVVGCKSLPAVQGLAALIRDNGDASLRDILSYSSEEGLPCAAYQARLNDWGVLPRSEMLLLGSRYVVHDMIVRGPAGTHLFVLWRAELASF